MGNFTKKEKVAIVVIPLLFGLAFVFGYLIHRIWS